VKKPVDWGGQKKINLALQGGGSHGAFTWGVLDALLEDGRLDIEAITGASAGAMNAVVFAQGYLENGRAGARQALAKFWEAISSREALLPASRDMIDRFWKAWGFDGVTTSAIGAAMSQFASPYDLNPLDVNPLRDHLSEIVDFAKVRACKQIQLFISATNVRTGKIRVFERKELTADHVMASACLPTLFKAVEIDGEPYWDGGYMGNPALFPLFYNTACPDILIVQINPTERRETPRTAGDIQNRLNEITFNGAMMGELRAVDFVDRLVDQGLLPPERYKRNFIHRVDGGAALLAFPASSKLDTTWDMLIRMRDIGRKAGKDWLAKHYDDVGRRDTLDLRLAYS
jgi:NTE family protein